MNIINSIILSVVSIFFINAYLMTFPVLNLRKKEYPPKYQIQQKNTFDMQKNKECAAYSTAYVLRHFGITAEERRYIKISRVKQEQVQSIQKEFVQC